MGCIDKKQLIDNYYDYILNYIQPPFDANNIKLKTNNNYYILNDIKNITIETINNYSDNIILQFYYNDFLITGVMIKATYNNNTTMYLKQDENNQFILLKSFNLNIFGDYNFELQITIFNIKYNITIKYKNTLTIPFPSLSSYSDSSI